MISRVAISGKMQNAKIAYFKKLLFIGLLFANGFVYPQSNNNYGFEVLSNDHCEVNISYISGDVMAIDYTSLPGNQAGLNHNSLWLWRSSIVPWKTPPALKQLLPTSFTQSGSYVLSGLTIEYAEYIVCYSVDSTAKHICACSVASVIKDNTSGIRKDTVVNSSINIELLSVSPNSLTFKYTTLTGYLPLEYGNWFGVWSGKASPYNQFPPMAIGKPSSNSESGTAGLNGVFFAPGQTYTFVYFTGKDPNTAAVIITFNAT